MLGGRCACVLSTCAAMHRQSFYPAEAIDFYGCNEAFQNMVGFQAEENHKGRCAKPQGNKGGGDNYEEHEEEVVFHNEGNVASAFYQSEKAGGLIAGADGGYG